MTNKILNAVLLAGAFLSGSIALAAIPLSLYFALAGKESQDTIAAGALALLILTGLGLGWKFNFFHQENFGLSITQEPQSLRLKDSRTLVTLTPLLRNRSNDDMKLSQAICEVHRIAPLTEAELKEVLAKAETNTVNGVRTGGYEWPREDKQTYDWSDQPLKLASDQNFNLSFHFALNPEVTLIQIKTSVYRPPKKKDGPAAKPIKTNEILNILEL